MSSQILINRGPGETRIARLEKGELSEIYIERNNEISIVGNIYKGRVNRVVPGMQAAFVDIGLEKDGFLYAGNVYDPNSDNSANDDSGTTDLEMAEIENGNEETETPSPEVRPAARAPRVIPEISKLLRHGEEILVQVVKEPLGTKGARLSGFLSIPGRFLVYLPNSRHIGISRRIENEMERSRLKEIVEKNSPAQGGLIVRTVAEGASGKHLKDDLEYLIRTWGMIKKQSEKGKAPSLVHADLDLATRILRDRVTEDVDKIEVDDIATFKLLQKFTANFLPKFKKRIELYTSEKTPIFDQHGIEAEINRALNRKVWLKSGGYIVIDENEALTTIDVNSGKFISGRNLEETILQTNLEAVKEVAYQIRLRNIGGIIVVDFIDMEKTSHRGRIYECFVEELKDDPVKTNVLPISQLGLIEMTRKRTHESLRRKLMEDCPGCGGLGLIRSRETVASQIIRACVAEARASTASSAGTSTIMVYCHPAVASYFAEEARDSVLALEEETKRKLAIKTDPNFQPDDYEVFSKDS
jgi:ribonuclease G